ncbi:hypothetical protein [Sphingomonas sp. LT1P40]|uniref:hypothetical protein n=1 Tax=Alteristakelama amylovorans TaxID=3096166 RepID=UPI002FC6256F
MTDKPSAKPIPRRALRLHEEASNCLAIAVRQTDRAFAADLIDEALRLAKRARELAT